MPVTKANIISWTKMAVAEIVGTGLLVFIGCMGCMSTLAGHEIPLEQICWTFGVIVMCVIEAFALVSGGHVNPTITLTAVVLGHIHYLKFFLYLFAQCLGAIIGFALLKATTPTDYFPGEKGFCCTVPNENCNAFQALGAEFGISFVLSIICGAVWDWRNAERMDSVPIKFGLAIAGLAMAGAPYSGGSMNPARSLAPALINNRWDAHWIYWVGPLAAAATAGTLYRFVFSAPKPED